MRRDTSRPQSHAALLCPGPTLSSYAFGFPDVPTAAVNGAVRHAVRVDWWVSMDPPGTQHVFDILAPLPVVVTRGGAAWDRWRARGFETVNPHVIPTVPAGCSSLHGLRHLVGEGFTSISVYGAPMCGEGYAAGIEGMGRDSTMWKARWVRERIAWGRAIRACRALGVRVRRVRT